MPSAGQDLGYGLRGLHKQPASPFCPVVTLGLGIGSASTIFSVIQNVLLETFPNVDRVVAFQIR